MGKYDCLLCGGGGRAITEDYEEAPCPLCAVWDVYHALDASTHAGDKLEAEEVLEELHKALTVSEVKP